MVWTKMSSEEMRLANMWYKEDGKSCYEIAQLLHRSVGTIVNRVRHRMRLKKQGRPCALTGAQVRVATAMLEKMVRKAKSEYEVTAEMLTKRLRLKVTGRALLRALRRAGDQVCIS